MAQDVADLSVEQLRRELLSLQRENNAAMKTIEKLLKDILKKNEEITHLQSLVSKTVPVIQSSIDELKNDISPEEAIANLQLARLNLAASTRALTLEETRMYDLLVKNKRLSQDKSNQNVSKGSFRDVSEIELVKIATASKLKLNGPGNK
jgi:phenylalanyl-tRNA synthetase alpha subunit